MKRVVSAIVLSFVCAGANASPRTTVLEWLSTNAARIIDAADTLWAIPEPAHEEHETSAYLKHQLEQAGFTVESNTANLPTAFVASFGSGRPVVGIVALLDALPGLSQAEGATVREPLASQSAGHGCGHNLIGAADLGAALAVQRAMATHALPGTIRLYGAPAEEIYHGGVYMTREGVFDDLDALLFWHPSAVTTVIARSGLAMDSVRYVYRGLASDATDAADQGINALDAAYRLADLTAREAWPASSVVNHVLTDGGTIPSIVPESATQWFFVHAETRERVAELRARVDAIARGVASTTGTSLVVQELSATSEWLINRGLAELLQRELAGEPPLSYTREDARAARALQASFGRDADETFFTDVLPLSFVPEPVLISDDTAEASWRAPRGGFLVACFPAGVPSHTWQWTASATSDFAHRGTLRAARILATTAVELLTNDVTLDAIREEFTEQTRERVYHSPLGDRDAFEFLPKSPR